MLLQLELYSKKMNMHWEFTDSGDELHREDHRPGLCQQGAFTGIAFVAARRRRRVARVGRETLLDYDRRSHPAPFQHRDTHRRVHFSDQALAGYEVHLRR